MNINIFEIPQEKNAAEHEKKVVCTAKADSADGWHGDISRTFDGRSAVKSLLASQFGRTKLEQLPPTDWLSCFSSSVGITVGRQKVKRPVTAEINAKAEVSGGVKVISLRANPSALPRELDHKQSGTSQTRHTSPGHIPKQRDGNL